VFQKRLILQQARDQKSFSPSVDISTDLTQDDVPQASVPKQIHLNLDPNLISYSSQKLPGLFLVMW
jgi:hypothetical protein